MKPLNTAAELIRSMPDETEIIDGCEGTDRRVYEQAGNSGSAESVPL